MRIAPIIAAVTGGLLTLSACTDVFITEVSKPEPANAPVVGHFQGLLTPRLEARFHFGENYELRGRVFERGNVNDGDYASGRYDVARDTFGLHVLAEWSTWRYGYATQVFTLSGTDTLYHSFYNNNQLFLLRTDPLPRAP